MFAEKDYNLVQHPEKDLEGVSNLEVIKLMQSLKSKEYVTERYAWRHFYWFLTDSGIEYLREYLNLPAEVVPATLMKSNRPLERGFGGDRPRRDGPPRGDRPERTYRSDKGGAPGDYNPSFAGAGYGRGAPAKSA